MYHNCLALPLSHDASAAYNPTISDMAQCHHMTNRSTVAIATHYGEEFFTFSEELADCEQSELLPFIEDLWN